MNYADCTYKNEDGYHGYNCPECENTNKFPELIGKTVKTAYEYPGKGGCFSIEFEDDTFVTVSDLCCQGVSIDIDLEEPKNE